MKIKHSFIVALCGCTSFIGCSQIEKPFAGNDSPITVADDSIKAHGKAYYQWVDKTTCIFSISGYQAAFIDVYDHNGNLDSTLKGQPFPVWGTTWSLTSSDTFATLKPGPSTGQVQIISSNLVEDPDPNDPKGKKKWGCYQKDIAFMPKGSSATLTINGASQNISDPHGWVCIHYCATKDCGAPVSACAK
jgi:hypothetical protein